MDGERSADVSGEVRGISIIIPAFNEAENLPIVVREVQQVARELALPDGHEIVIVDDGSRDGTREVVTRIAAENAHVVVCKHATNRGLGAALLTGYAAAEKPFVCYFPADGQVPPSTLHDLISAIGPAEIVTTAYDTRPDTPIRLLQSRVERLIIRLLFPEAPDIRGVPRLMRRGVPAELPLSSSSGFVNFELLLMAARRGRKIETVIIGCRPRIGGESKVNNWRTILRTLRELVKLRCRRF